MATTTDAASPAPPAGLDPAVAGWVESVTSGRIVRARPVDRWRPNWTVDVATARGERALFLKFPRLPPAVVQRSVMLSTFGTAREAAALAAVQGTGVAAPELLGLHEMSGAVLVGRVGGVGVLQHLPPAVRSGLMRQYARQLATIHDLDLGPEALARLAAAGDGPDRPGPVAAALADHASVTARVGRPDPLIDLAVRWLGENAPAGTERRLLHGDAGPNQFMADGGRLTAVLDWEIAHLGDPTSDLGYTRFRECLYPSGAFGAFLAEYRAVSGRGIDRAALDYFTVAAALLLVAGVARDVQRPSAHNPEAAQRFWWDALGRVAICEVLGARVGLLPLVWPEPVDGELTPLGSLVTGRLAPRAAGQELLLAHALLRASRTRPDAAQAADAAELLGLRDPDPARRLAALAEMVAGPDPDVPALVTYLGRDAMRRLYAFVPLSATDTWDGPETAGPDPDGWDGERLPALPLLPAVPDPA